MFVRVIVFVLYISIPSVIPIPTQSVIDTISDSLSVRAIHHSLSVTCYVVVFNVLLMCYFPCDSVVDIGIWYWCSICDIASV